MDYLRIVLLCSLIFGCRDSVVDNVQSKVWANAGGDQISYIGSYAILDPSKSRLDGEKITLVEWVRDIGNPEEVVTLAYSTLLETNVVGFRMGGVYKFTLKISCQNGSIYKDSLVVSVGSRQTSLIEDVNLEIRIRKKLNYKEGALTGDKLQMLDSLSTADFSLKNKIVNINGMEYCTKSTYLLLGLESISDLHPLTRLTNLKVLDLNQNYTIRDISPLYDLVNLEILVLYSNPITDISGLGKMTKLKELYLMYTPISDVSSLSSLVNLEKLYLDGVGTNVPLGSINPLQNLAKLNYLNLPGRGITDITALGSLTELVLLDLSYNSLVQVSGISNMKRLVRLYIRSNKISNISGIKDLESLDFLDAADNKLSDISELQQLPNIHSIGLDGNSIEDISPIVNNPNIGKGVYLYLRNNPLSAKSINKCIPALTQRGVVVFY